MPKTPRKPPPLLYRPQLATLVKSPPEGDEWVHEIKYDGYRIGCRIVRGKVTLLSRNGKDWTASFPEIAEAARRLAVGQALVDGEIAMVLPDGRTSFQALQNAFSGGARRGLVYFVFDLLHQDGEELLALPLEERKRRLRRLVGRASARARIRYSEHVTASGAAFLEHACRIGLEGILSKRQDSRYQPGRHDAWLKTKCITRQEFVIGGFTDPEGKRKGIGALLVGYYDKTRRLVFSGKVGTGFSQQVARSLRQRLEALARPDCPFEPPPKGWLGRHAHWVRPELVCDVAFSEWTTDGKIRHPAFQGLREDKRPQEVGLEKPVAPSPASRTGRGRRR